MNWFVKALLNTWNFSGRACRREFWYSQLVLTLIGLIAIIADYKLGLVPEDAIVGTLTVAVAILFSVTNISLIVRRLHDSNLSGFWALAVLLPFGNILVMILAVRPTDPNENRFGPPPSDHTPGQEISRPDSDETGRFDA